MFGDQKLFCVPELLPDNKLYNSRKIVILYFHID